MIVLQTPSFVALGADEQTTKKAARLIVLYHTPDKGKVTAWARVERQTNAGELDGEGNPATPVYTELTNALHKEYTQDEFVGKDILATIQADFLATLQTLNPTINFIIE